MRRTNLALVSAVIGGTAILAMVSVWPPRCPIEFRVADVEHLQNTPIYWGERKAMQVTLSVSNSDLVSVWIDMPTFEAKAGERWIVVTQFLGPFPGINGPGSNRMSPGEKRDLSLLVPEGSEACRVQLRYTSGQWKSRFIERIGPTGRRWVAQSHWPHRFVWPASDSSMRTQQQLWKSTTVEIVIPQK